MAQGSGVVAQEMDYYVHLKYRLKRRPAGRCPLAALDGASRTLVLVVRRPRHEFSDPRDRSQKMGASVASATRGLLALGVEDIRGLTLMPSNQPGFWEQYGYHIHGDPWKEERYW